MSDEPPQSWQQHPRRVYVTAAGMQDGPLTDRPGVGLAQQCLQAAAEALGGDRGRAEAIEAVYLGTMGVQRGLERGGLDVSHLPNLVRSKLNLPNVRHVETVTSTSETGAAVFAEAVHDLRSGRFATVLVLAGEQMFSPGGDRAEEARAIQAWIRGIVDGEECHRYGISMLQVGDLLMDHLAWRSGLPESLWRDILETVTLDKYALSHGHLRAFVPARERVKGALTAQQYRDPQRNPPISHWYHREDVCPNANGATALLLTTRRDLLPAHGVHLALLGLGQSHTKISLRERPLPLAAPVAVRRALRDLCLDAGVAPAWLADEPRLCGVLHDAFPAIELCVLLSLAGERGWPWAIEKLLAAWGHPFGGLSAGGHALGNSGLMHVAQAWQLATGDARSLDLRSSALADRLGAVRPGLFLTSSVGSALTRMVMTLLGDLNDPRIARTYENEVRRQPETDTLRALAPAHTETDLSERLDELAPDTALVVARARVDRGNPPDVATVHALYAKNPQGPPHLLLALAAARLPLGSAARLHLRDATWWAEGVDGAVLQVPPATWHSQIEVALHALRTGRLAARYGTTAQAIGVRGAEVR